MNFSITQNGNPLPKDKYTWDEKTKTLSTKESNLVLDFSGIDGVIFKTGSRCTFKTGSRCTFDTSYSCTFKTGSRCTFDTGSDCTFDTDYDCVVIRRDVYEVIELKEGQIIKLNGHTEKGFSVIEEETELTIDEIADKLGIPVGSLKIKTL